MKAWNGKTIDMQDVDASTTVTQLRVRETSLGVPGTEISVSSYVCLTCVRCFRQRSLLLEAFLILGILTDMACNTKGILSHLLVLVRDLRAWQPELVLCRLQEDVWCTRVRRDVARVGNKKRIDCPRRSSQNVTVTTTHSTMVADNQVNGVLGHCQRFLFPGKDVFSIFVVIQGFFSMDLFSFPTGNVET